MEIPQYVVRTRHFQDLGQPASAEKVCSKSEPDANTLRIPLAAP